MAIGKTLPASTYREVLRRAYAAAKKYKFLWFFGFFAAFLGAGGEFESLFNSYVDIGERSRGIFSLRSFYQDGFLWSMYESTMDFFSANPWQAFLFFLLLLVVILVIVWLAIVSQIGLFDAGSKIAKGTDISYGDAYRNGNRHFGSVLLINLTIKVVMYAIFVLIGTPLVATFLLRDSLLAGTVFVVIVFFVFVPISVVASFVVKYAIAYIVIKDKPAGESIKLGWKLFREQWLVSIEMAFIILVIGICVGLFILLLMGIAAVPFILIAIAGLFFASQQGFVVALVFGTVAWFAIAAIVGAAYVTFNYLAWTFLFLKLVDEKAQSKLARWIGKFSMKSA
ncbi:MAG: hypothetical protein WC505_03390 [Patescibacteria group bacterium]